MRRSPGLAARCDQVGLWILRAILVSEEYEDVYSRNMEDRFLRSLGLEVPAERDELKPSELRRIIEQRVVALEEMDDEVRRTGPLFVNVERLGRLLGLGEVEREVVAFGVALTSEEPLASIFSEICLGMSTGSAAQRLHAAVTRIIGVPADQVREAMAPTATLVTTGLLRLGRRRSRLDPDSPLLVMDGLASALLREQLDEDRLMDTFFRAAPQTKLTAKDFAHVDGPLALLERYLFRVSSEGRAGVNVLLYGPAGTGKTELSRLLGRRLGLSCFEVSVEDDEQEALTEHERLAAYRVTQRILARGQPSLVIFDEVEDVLPRRTPSLFGIDTGRSYRKGFMHRLLEENPVPSLWVTNQARHLDPALLRRFSHVLELGPPPHGTRRRMMAKCCKGLDLPERLLDRLARNRHLTPADLERAVGVVHALDVQSPDEAESAFLQVLDSGLVVRGHGSTRQEPERPLEYDERLVCAAHDLSRVASGLAALPEPRGRLLLYGPPGTGKTAWVHHLGHRLNREVLVKRASDLLSKWVGESEQNIAGMFAQARMSGDILLLDEADSLLHARESAQRSWEVTRVNELLVQLETFDGLFVASTNLLGDVDRAAFRRFDLKVEFDYLEPAQRYALLETMLAGVSGGVSAEEPLSASHRRRLDGLDRLTPGDAAVVMRRRAFLGASMNSDHADVEVLLAALEEEHAAKPGATTRKVGFGATR